jgi:hypothetical protein
MYHSNATLPSLATSYKSAFASMARMHEALTRSFDMSIELRRESCYIRRKHITPCYEAGKWCTEQMLLSAKVRDFWHASINRGAAVAGRVKLLSWLMAHMSEKEWDAGSVATAALQRPGNLRVLEWLQEQGQLPQANTNPHLPAVAAERNDTEALTWLHAQGHQLDCLACFAAARSGALQALQFLTERGAPMDDDICKAAATSGSMQLLLWLSEQGFINLDDPECSQMMLYHAGTTGQLELGKWLRERGAPWPEGVVDCREIGRCSIDFKEQFEFFKWAITNGCPWGDGWTSEDCEYAYNHNLEGWLWIHEHGCPCDCST